MPFLSLSAVSLLFVLFSYPRKTVLVYSQSNIHKICRFIFVLVQLNSTKWDFCQKFHLVELNSSQYKKRNGYQKLTWIIVYNLVLYSSTDNCISSFIGGMTLYPSDRLSFFVPKRDTYECFRQLSAEGLFSGLNTSSFLIKSTPSCGAEFGMQSFWTVFNEPLDQS